MVSINGREVLRRVAGILRTHYARCLARIFHGRCTVLGRSSSFAHPNLCGPLLKLAPLPPKKTWTQVVPSGQIPKGRKQGRVKRKRYNDLAKNNSITFIPGGPRKKAPEKEKEKERKKKKKHTHRKDMDRDPNDDESVGSDHGLSDNESIDFDPDFVDEAFVKKEFESLMFEKDKSECLFEIKVVSERVKGQAVERKARLERETRQAERLWKMQELERHEEKERADRWKDQRLAQLEREKQTAESELAREKVERKQSKLRRVFKEQQLREREEEHWKQLREKDAMLAAEREKNLLRKNAMLQDNLRATDDALRRACNERDHIKREKEEERVRRLRAEGSLLRWKKLMKKYFPGDQQERPQQQPLPQTLPSLEAQFDLYEKKWKVLRSGVDIDGSKIHPVSFSQIPWPVVNMVLTDPSQILPKHIQEFLMHPLREKSDASKKRKSMRSRAKDELKKWHSDQFNRIVLSKVREEDKKAASEAGGIIARVLTDMLS